VVEIYDATPLVPKPVSAVPSELNRAATISVPSPLNEA